VKNSAKASGPGSHRGRGDDAAEEAAATADAIEVLVAATGAAEDSAAAEERGAAVGAAACPATAGLRGAAASRGCTAAQHEGAIACRGVWQHDMMARPYVVSERGIG
jgi:hypothetical protein